jgi:hypothetical protein
MTPPARVSGIGKVPNGALTDVGLSIMQLGMVTGLHAAISPSFFTFACFAKKPEECLIAKKTLWVSLLATTVVNAGILLAFKRWAPAITGQIVGTGLFVGGMLAVGSTDGAPPAPSMSPNAPPLKGIGSVKATCVGCKEQVNLAGGEGEKLGVRCLYCGNIYCKECAHQHFKQDAHDARHMGEENFRKSAHDESEKTTGTFRTPMPGESPYDSAELGPVHKSYHVGQPDAMVVS